MCKTLKHNGDKLHTLQGGPPTIYTLGYNSYNPSYPITRPFIGIIPPFITGSGAHLVPTSTGYIAGFLVAINQPYVTRPHQGSSAAVPCSQADVVMLSSMEPRATHGWTHGWTAPETSPIFSTPVSKIP